MGQKWYQPTADGFLLFRWAFFKNLKSKRVFIVKGHFVVECPVNLETAANLCYSGALKAAITVIAGCRAPQ
jgi:hypothetical protein